MNTQPPIPRDNVGSTHLLSVFKIWKTIQGEGPFAGMPAVFVRFYGCNLQCPFCDTDYTSIQVWMTPEEVAERVCDLMGEGELVVFTGGEPFRQPKPLKVLSKLLIDEGFQLQVETNGSYAFSHDWSDQFHIVCSPKVPKINRDLLYYVNSFKYVLEAGKVSEQDGLPLNVLGNPFPPGRPAIPSGPLFDPRLVFVQPLDDGSGSHFDPATTNYQHLEATLASVDTYGYRLCLQIQKYIGKE